MSLFDTETINRLDARSIRARKFARVRRGFDPDQVRDFLDEVAAWIEQLEGDLRDAQQEADAATRRTQPGGDPYGKLGSHVAELVRGAEEAASRTRREAEEEANLLVAAARQEAEKIRGQVKAQADTTIGEARLEADRLRTEAKEQAAKLHTEATGALERAKAESAATLAGIQGHRDELLGELRHTRVRLAAALDRLDDAIAVPEEEKASEPAAPVLPPEPAIVKASEPTEPAVAPPPTREEEPKPPAPTEESFEASPPDPWALSASFDRDLFGDIGDVGDSGPIGEEPSTPAEGEPARLLFDADEDFDLSIPDIPLIEDRPEDESA